MPTIYGVEKGNSQALLQVDTDTLAWQENGNVSRRIGGGAFDGGTFFASDTTNQDLITINPTNAARTIVGSLGLPVTWSSAMAVDPTNGQLYCIAEKGYNLSSRLCTVNKTNGAMFQVADLQLPAPVVGMDFDSGGQLYVITGQQAPRLFRIDKSDGSITAVGAGLGNSPAGVPWAFFGSLCIDSKDAAFSIDIDRYAGTPSNLLRLCSVDLATGIMTSLGDLAGSNMQGGNFVNRRGVTALGTAE